ncbi:MAG TPA: CoA-binding protein [Caulobacteraceae bacterium]|nr:CoA-binding protein [Caulobacteraceae bacterium]
MSQQKAADLLAATKAVPEIGATLDQKVQDFLAQRRIAIAGASGDPRHPVGAAIYRRLKSSGHEVFAVNPHQQVFEGAPCYPDLQSIPGGVDAVVIVTRPAITEQIVRDCAAEGVRRVWMHSSGSQGSSVSPEAVEFCAQHGTSVIAGACPMMYGEGVDFGHKCMKLMLRLSGGLPA